LDVGRGRVEEFAFLCLHAGEALRRRELGVRRSAKKLVHRAAIEDQPLLASLLLHKERLDPPPPPSRHPQQPSLHKTAQELKVLGAV